jgi:hypothetical protein
MQCWWIFDFETNYRMVNLPAGEAGFKSKKSISICPIDNPSKASETILYLSKTEGAIFLTRII